MIMFKTGKCLLNSRFWNTIEPIGVNRAKPKFLYIPEMYFCCSLITLTIYQMTFQIHVTLGYMGYKIKNILFPDVTRGYKQFWSNDILNIVFKQD